ncbi:MAG TPA: alpha/beta hydrolase [Anaerolineaceae bacterium]
MDMPLPLPGVRSLMVDTPRLKQHVLRSGGEGGIPVVFLHGNFSSALFWEETMLALPETYQAIAPDLRGYGWTEDKLIDATRGMGDWVDDLDALLAELGITKAHFVGWSMGAGILYALIADKPGLVLSATLIAPVPPYGFGGTKGLEGVPCHPDYAGSGGGLVNPTFVERIIAGDRSADDPNSPRNVINSFYYKPPFRAAREEDFLTGAMMEKMGTDRYPGDFTPSQFWPNVAPGVWGPTNAFSSKYMAGLAEKFIAAEVKPPVLWVHGSHDMIVGDASFFDIGNLGKMGFIPGYPGEEVYPPQPMVAQMRFVLEKYAAAGGKFQEEVIADTGHGPHIEKPAEFGTIFHAFLQKA